MLKLKPVTLVFCWSLALLSLAACGDQLGGATPEQRFCQGEDAGGETPMLEEIDLPVIGDQSTLARVRKVAPELAKRSGVIFVSGVDGGFIEPVDDIYSRVADKFAGYGVASIFVKYRQAGNLDTSVNDALAAAIWLRNRGVTRMALVGWSFGGAVVINSALRIPEVATVVGFAPQNLYTNPVSSFVRQSLLLVHSRGDTNVTFDKSEDIMSMAPEYIRKELFELQGYEHLMNGAREEVDPVVEKWLEEELLQGTGAQPAC